MKPGNLIILLFFCFIIFGCAEKAFKEARTQNTVAAYDRFLKENGETVFASKARELREKLWFEQSKQQNTIASYDKYLAEYPRGKYVSQAQKTREALWFEKSKSEDTIASYDDYLKEYPHGENTNKVKKLRIEKYFSIVRNKNTIEGYDEFVRKYPHSSEAKQAIAAEFQLYLKLDTIEGYDEFVRKHPHSSEAKQAITAEFQLYLKLDTIEGYDEFMNKYPQSNFTVFSDLIPASSYGEPIALPQSLYQPGTFLLKTNWDQGFPFNKAVPKVNGKRTVVGCTNTALAQILYYYRYPQSPRGIVHHKWNEQELMSVFYKTYHWELLSPSDQALMSQYQIDEIAELFRDLGISNHTEFGDPEKGGSGAAIRIDALCENFGYSCNTKSTTNADPRFTEILKNEIDNRHPVLLAISGKPSGHVVVIDGYKKDEFGIKFHLNMGWGGTGNGYYDLNQTIKVQSKVDKNDIASDYYFTDDLKAYYGIVPCEGSDCYTNLESDDFVDGLKIQGVFDHPKDKDVYDMVFDGMVTFRGDLARLS